MEQKPQVAYGPQIADEPPSWTKFGAQFAGAREVRSPSGEGEQGEIRVRTAARRLAWL